MARWIREAKQKVLIEKSIKLLFINESCNVELFNPSADLCVSDLRKVINARGQYLQKQFERH